MNVRYSFRGGKLYHFHFGVLDIARPWGPQAGAWRLNLQQGWRVPRPVDFQISVARSWCQPSVRGRSTANEIRGAAMRAFLDAFPKEALRSVAPFRESNWTLLQLLNRCGGPARELLASTPALAMLLAERRRLIHDARLTRLDSVRRALSWKQPRILERFGFPPSNAVVNVLRKVDSSVLGPTVLRHLRVCLWRPDVLRLACHLPRINRCVVRFLRDPELLSLVAPSFLRDIGAERYRDRSLRWAFEVCELRRLAQVHGRERPPLIRSTAQARELHARWAALPEHAVFDNGTIDWERTDFGEPPLHALPGIEPIRTASELRQEAAEMGHCAWTYAPEAARGDCYFYRLRSPERATLCLSPGAEETWMLREIRGPGNAEVSRETLSRVERWLTGRDRAPDPRQLLLFPDLLSEFPLA